MTWDRELLKHVLHLDPGVFFVLPEDLSRERFLAAVATLERHGTPETSITAEQYWSRLNRRSRWDAIVRRFSGPFDTGEELKRQRASFQSVPNIVREREYASFRLDDVTVTLDLFNPSNELEMPYLGAGEPVVVLLLRGPQPSVVQTELADRPTVYRALRELDEILVAGHVCGTHSFAPLAFAYDEGRLSPSIRPWELLFELTVLPEKDLPDDSMARKMFRKVDRWPRSRVLLQVRGGLESVLALDYPKAARFLGKTAIQELIPGANDCRVPLRPKDVLRPKE